MAAKGKPEPEAPSTDIWVRRLGPTDTAVLARLAQENGRFGESNSRPALDPLAPSDARTFLSDERTIFLVAFQGEFPVGFVYACELYRRHSELRHLCVYEIGVAESHRGRGIGAQLLQHLAEQARKRQIHQGFVVTAASDREVMELYQSVGGVRGPNDDVVWVLQF
jgi:aminoglycoside 6'-N-acetyltransferase I